MAELILKIKGKKAQRLREALERDVSLKFHECKDGSIDVSIPDE